MQALSVLLVGFTPQEKNIVKTILKRTGESFLTRSCNREMWLRGDAPLGEHELILLRCRQGDVWDASTLVETCLEPHCPPVFAFSDSFDPNLVTELNNSGIERVIPMEQVEELLPSCLGYFFQRDARAARRAQLSIERDDRPLQGSEERFAHIFNTNPIGMCILAYQDGQILNVNDSLARLLESTKEELTGKKLLEESLAQDFGKFRDEVDRSVLGGKTLVLQRRLLTRQRKSIHVSLTADLVDWGGEKGVFILILDIRDRVQAEETIRRINEDLESRVLERTASYETVNRALQQEIGFRKSIEQTSERLMQIVWETPDIVAMCDLNGRLLFLNKTGRQILGLDDEAPISL